MRVQLAPPADAAECVLRYCLSCAHCTMPFWQAHAVLLVLALVMPPLGAMLVLSGGGIEIEDLIICTTNVGYVPNNRSAPKTPARYPAMMHKDTVVLTKYLLCGALQFSTEYPAQKHIACTLKLAMHASA